MIVYRVVLVATLFCSNLQAMDSRVLKPAEYSSVATLLSFTQPVDPLHERQSLAMSAYAAAIKDQIQVLSAIAAQQISSKPAIACTSQPGAEHIRAQAAELRMSPALIYAQSDAQRDRSQKSQRKLNRKSTKRKANRRDHMCKKCSKSFNTDVLMRSHFKMKHVEKKYICTHDTTKCATTFFTQKLLDLHVRTVHLGEKPFVCKKCAKRYTDDSTRRKHEDRCFA